MITQLQLSHFTGSELATKYYNSLVEELPKYHINTRLRICAFLAQILHESGGFHATRENLNYTAIGLKETWPGLFPNFNYANQIAHQPELIANYVYGHAGNRLGNNQTGDGWKYRGGGPMGITGRANYTLLAHDTGIDYVNHPELIEDAKNYIDSATWFWDKFNLNKYADIPDYTAVTQHINGGQIGADDRVKKYTELLSIVPIT